MGRLSNPSEGPAFEPLISKGLKARVLNSLDVAYCESSLRASAQSERTIEDRLGFLLYAPSSPFRKEEEGGRAMLPSVGAEHGVFSELLLGNPSGRLSPVR